MGMFSGKTGNQSSSSNSSSSKDSIQKQINAEQARIGKGNWNQKLNDLVKQRDNASSGSSSGIKSLGTALKNAPKNIASDIGMGLGLKDRDADYYRRTANTIARTQGSAAADRYIKQMTAKGGDAAAGVAKADVSGSVDYGQRIGMLNADGSVNTKYMSSDDGGGAVTNEAAPEEDMSSIYDDNRRRYEEFMQSQQPQQPTVTPEMRREALNIFESQQGAGQMPYYMAAARGGPNASPAFNYAAQNYATLGGSQRLAPRPMEMMSVAERQRINDMAQGMADQEAARQAAENDYQAGMDMVLRGGGKGGPRTGPQLPPGMVGLPRTPDYGGQRSPFASILASRFGGFGG